MSVFLIRKRFFCSGRRPRAEADRKSALRGDREMMFEDFLAIVICPGAEASWCECWIENMQRPAWHRRRA
jgi:hypothetical protein